MINNYAFLVTNYNRKLYFEIEKNKFYEYYINISNLSYAIIDY